MMGIGGGPPPPPPGPPPPPPPPPPKITLNRENPKSKDVPQTPKKPATNSIGQAQGDVMEELKARLANRGTPRSKTPFREPVRTTPKTPPSLADQIAAELPSGKAKLRPVGSKAGDWMKREQEAQREREDGLKKEIRPPRVPATPKQPLTPPVTEHRPVKPPEPAKPVVPKIFKPVRTPKPPEPDAVHVEERVERNEELKLKESPRINATARMTPRGDTNRDEGIELYLWVISMATTLGLEDLL
ncbi:hypothetical protein TWF696_005076 [Orbilia brochopaga]|uniref:WH2 domain-containing protein n=1 Tax=Orbilia brochopaga TaxID=3140254 RepID=A0AAV9V684_9PEZI